MRLMRFSNEITRTAGKNLMTADTLSRVPGSSPVKEDLQQETEMDIFVRSMIENISVSDKRLEEIKQKQNTASICSQVIHFYNIDYWPEAASRDLKLRPHWFVRQDLTVYEGLLLYQSRLVIPVDLQNDTKGIVKCRSLARENVWWPGLSKQIAEKVGNCSECEKERKYPPEPLPLLSYQIYPENFLSTVMTTTHVRILPNKLTNQKLSSLRRVKFQSYAESLLRARYTRRCRKIRSTKRLSL